MKNHIITLSLLLTTNSLLPSSNYCFFTSPLTPKDVLIHVCSFSDHQALESIIEQQRQINYQGIENINAPTQDAAPKKDSQWISLTKLCHAISIAYPLLLTCKRLHNQSLREELIEILIPSIKKVISETIASTILPLPISYPLYCAIDQTDLNNIITTMQKVTQKTHLYITGEIQKRPCRIPEEIISQNSYNKVADFYYFPELKTKKIYYKPFLQFFLTVLIVKVKDLIEFNQDLDTDMLRVLYEHWLKTTRYLLNNKNIDLTAPLETEPQMCLGQFIYHQLESLKAEEFKIRRYFNQQILKKLQESRSSRQKLNNERSLFVEYLVKIVFLPELSLASIFKPVIHLINQKKDSLKSEKLNYENSLSQSHEHKKEGDDDNNNNKLENIIEWLRYLNFDPTISVNTLFKMITKER